MDQDWHHPAIPHTWFWSSRSLSGSPEFYESQFRQFTIFTQLLKSVETFTFLIAPGVVHQLVHRVSWDAAVALVIGALCRTQAAGERHVLLGISGHALQNRHLAWRSRQPVALQGQGTLVHRTGHGVTHPEDSAHRIYTIHWNQSLFHLHWSVCRVTSQRHLPTTPIFLIFLSVSWYLPFWVSREQFALSMVCPWKWFWILVAGFLCVLSLDQRASIPSEFGVQNQASPSDPARQSHSGGGSSGRAESRIQGE